MTMANPDPTAVEQEQNNSDEPRDNQRRGLGLALIIFIAVVLIITLALFGGWVFLQRAERMYRSSIYPHVYSLGVDLGGLSPQQAVVKMEPVAEQFEQGILEFSDGEQSWTYTWDDVGFHIDLRATALAAYDVGRGGTWRDLARVWLDYTEIPPRYTMNEDAASALLKSLATDISQPAEPATLVLEQGKVVVIPGKPGKALDVDAAVDAVLSLDEMALHVKVPLTYITVPPVDPDPEAMQTKVDPWLERSIEIQTFDVLRGQAFSWTLDGKVIGSWLYLLPGSSGGAPNLAVNPALVLETFEQLAAETGPGLGFRYDEVVDEVLTALEQDIPQLTLYLTHPERTYVVQAGDTLTNIAAKYGMPAGLLAEANPDIDVNALHVDQEIVIPSQDVLTPHMPVANKKIEVSLAEQRVRVYEDGELLWEWVTSTGIADSPTNRGVFQVLSKEENAYASQWELWMPYFIGVYDAGGNVTNGFHELPILTNGARLWAGTLGNPASFGCIILGIPEAETLYNWVELGVPVVIY